MTKIYISGGPGSGKTTYAKQLSQKLNIPCFDLDEVKWVDPKTCFNKERTEDARMALLNKILSENNDWICEGIYFQDWISPVIKSADKIIILAPSVWVRQWRIIKRSLKKMFLTITKFHAPNSVTLFTLLKWSQQYEKENLPVLMEKIKRYNKPYEVIKK